MSIVLTHTANDLNPETQIHQVPTMKTCRMYMDLTNASSSFPFKALMHYEGASGWVLCLICIFKAGLFERKFLLSIVGKFSVERNRALWLSKSAWLVIRMSLLLNYMYSWKTLINTLTLRFYEQQEERKPCVAKN